MRSVPCRNSLQVSGLTWHSEAGNSTQGTLKFYQFKSGLIHLPICVSLGSMCRLQALLGLWLRENPTASHTVD